MIKSKFTFFKVQIKSVLRYTMKLLKSSFRKRPERLCAVNMTLIISKLIITVLNPIVLLIADIYQSAITSPLVRMNNTFRRYFASNNGLQRGFSAVWHNLCIDFAASLQNTQNGCFTISASTSFAFLSACTKIGFINFYLSSEWRVLFTKFRYSCSYHTEVSINSVAI